MISAAQFFIGAVPGFLSGVAVGAIAMLFIIKYAIQEESFNAVKNKCELKG